MLSWLKTIFSLLSKRHWNLGALGRQQCQSYSCGRSWINLAIIFSSISTPAFNSSSLNFTSSNSSLKTNSTWKWIHCISLSRKTVRNSPLSSWCPRYYQWPACGHICSMLCEPWIQGCSSRSRAWKKLEHCLLSSAGQVGPAFSGHTATERDRWTSAVWK